MSKVCDSGYVERLEKVHAAAKRMGVSVSGVYRELKDGRLGPLVRVGVRASAIPSRSVDEWIAARIADEWHAHLGERHARHRCGYDAVVYHRFRWEKGQGMVVR